MDVLLTVRGTRDAADDVRISVDADAPGRELIDALADARGARQHPSASWVVARTRDRVVADRPIRELGLHDGDVLVRGDDPRASARSAEPGGRYELLVSSGPDAGARFALDGAEHFLGRASPSDLVVHDDEVSRRHVHLGVGSRCVTITDLESRNGTFVDGRRIDATTEITPGQVLEIGATQLVIEDRRGAAGPAAAEDSEAHVLFSRPPRVARPAKPSTVRLPIPPEVPPPKRIPLIAALAPVLIGVVLYFVMGPVMLIFALLGPVMLFASIAEDKRSGRRAYRANVARFEEDMGDVEERVAEAHDVLLKERRAAAITPAHLLGLAQGPASQLWERRPTDVDFLTLRIGVGDLPTRLQLEGPSDEQLAEMSGEHARRLREIRDAVFIDANVPVDADLRGLGVLGISGPRQQRESALRWLTAQAVVLASPRDLAVVGLVPEEDTSQWDWLKWLPHAETLLSGIPDARSVATGADDVRAVFQAVSDLVDQRRIIERREGGFGGRNWHPQVLLVIPGSVPIPRASLSRLLTDGPQYGVTAIVGAPATEHLPGECRAVVRAEADGTCAVTITASGDTIQRIALDRLDSGFADDLAHLLAPIRDVSTSSASSEAPRSVSLLEVLRMPEPTSDLVRGNWQHSLGDAGLGAPIGIGAAGVASLDLRHDGPHGLTAGTTGSGKSEFLQSLVGALAACHPASRLTFVLVDYKGGAAFKDCVPLPHTVGFFTDLDAHLAHRALSSLNAELRRREEVLREHGAKDLIDLEHSSPAHAPANLFIVFDEFAFLKKEVPEFVAGVIDIAQRGRSLGVHLMLATQRPSGVVDENIRANTNLRIALRMADDQDSNDVIDRPDAAHIPKSIPGRAYVRIGQDVALVQTAYGGVRTSPGRSRVATSVAPFTFTSGLVSSATSRRGASGWERDDRPTDLQRLVEAIRAAHQDAGIPDQPHPWLDPLRDVYPLTAFANDPDGSADDLSATIGMVDLPSSQSQRPWRLGLSESGHVLFYGTSGSGKTTALRTLATALALRSGPDDLHLYGLDFGSRGLGPLAALPHCGGIVGADEPERIDALLGLLTRAVDERKRMLASSGAATLSEHRGLTGDRIPHLLVLLDNFGAFYTTYQNVDRGEQVDRLIRLIGDGRAAGLHFAIAADRRNAVPTSIAASISARVVLRLSDPDEYATLGLPTALASASLPPGRAFSAGDEVQLAVLGTEGSGAEQSAAIAALARELAPASVTPPPLVATLGDEVALADLDEPVAGRRVVPFARIGATLGTAWVDLEDTPLFGVLGPDRSGKSTALSAIAAGIGAATPSMERYLLAPRPSPAVGAVSWTRVAQGVSECEETIRGLVDVLRDRLAGEAGPPLLVAIDDGDELAEGAAADGLAALLRRGRDAGMVIVAAVQTHTVHRTFGGWLTDLRKAKHAMLLMPDVDLDGELMGTRLPRQASHRFPPGRGFLIRRGAAEYSQVAFPQVRSMSGSERSPSRSESGVASTGSDTAVPGSDTSATGPS